MKLTLNREYLKRHLFAALLFAGLGGWFGWDGYVRYPSLDEAYFTERHLVKETAVERQRQFMLLAFLASLVVAVDLWKVSRLAFEFDESAFTCNGVTRPIDSIASVDRSQWEKKGILRVDGIKLDAWHHVGVREFEKRLKK